MAKSKHEMLREGACTASRYAQSGAEQLPLAEPRWQDGSRACFVGVWIMEVRLSEMRVL